MVEDTQKMILVHSNRENLWRLESIAVMRMFSLNLLEFRFEKIVYFNEHHGDMFIRTPDSRLFRFNVFVDDNLRVEETEYTDENKYYCDMYNSLRDLANSIPEKFNENVLKEAEKVRPLCK